MGSYYIPSNKLKGESRILYIFTAKSLIYTGVGGLIGLIFYLIFFTHHKILPMVFHSTIGRIIYTKYFIISFF